MTHLVSVVMAEERSIAWLALQPGTAIVGSDGEQVGKVGEVIADREKDIFSGVTFKPGLMDSALFIPAERIADLTDTEVTLTIPAAEASELEPYDS
jgi:sporulation protein YlmC with PRC-barrel domain